MGLKKVRNVSFESKVHAEQAFANAKKHSAFEKQIRISVSSVQNLMMRL